METLLILGASARAAAQSARRAGFEPVCGDLFADADLRRCATVVRAKRYPRDLVAIAASAPPCPWMYTGGLENHPAIVDRIAANRPLLGNPGDVLLAVRDPFRLADELGRTGIPFPPVRQGPREVPADGTWLLKPRAGSGGAGIRPWRKAETAGPSHGCYFQQYVAGEPCAAVYVAAGGEAALLGVTSQRLSETGGEACRFRYGGSLGPLELSDSLREQFERIGRRLSESFRLVGLFGVDAVVAGAAVWPIEVNPRYTASIEVLERALGIAAVGLHADACRLGRLPREVRRRRAWCGKAVLYARSKLVVPAAFSGCPETGTGTLHRVVDGRSTPNTPEPVPVSGQPLARLADDATRDGAWPALADVPDAGCTIRAGSPVATVLAEAETQEDLIERLANLEAQAERLLYADPEPGPGL